MSITVSCIYTLTDSNGYYDTWKTSCGKSIRINAPEEIGMSFAPLPTDDGARFCTYCGKPIMLRK